MNGTVYNVFTGPLCTVTDGVLTTTTPGPQHRSCALYAILACPFLAHRASPIRFQTTAATVGGTTVLQHNPARNTEITRGPAALVGFLNFEVITDSTTLFDPIRGQAVPLVKFNHHNLIELIEFESADELSAIYEQAIELDSPNIDTSTRLYWTDSAADTAALAEYERAWGNGTGLTLRPDRHSVGTIAAKRSVCPIMSVAQC